jgi:hypothetical protein
MAILISYLPFFDACHRNGLVSSPTWVLGSQQFIDGSAYRALTGGTELPEEPTAADVFRHRYGVAEYVDFDLNEDASFHLDLTAPLPSDLRHGAATLVESGTLEHIFDFATALENAHEMIRPEGSFVALVPVSWWNHGFVNLSPRLFTSFAAANGYELVVEGFWFRVRLPLLGTRIRTVLTRDGEPRPRAQLWVDRVLNRALPARTLYLVGLRKVDDRPFRAPTDVFGNW